MTTEQSKLADRLTQVQIDIQMGCDPERIDREIGDIVAALRASPAPTGTQPMTDTSDQQAEESAEDLGFADVGQSFVEEYDRLYANGSLRGFTCLNSPVEVLVHLINERDEARALAAPSPVASAERQAIRAIIVANNDFREGMPAEWDGDPLQDAINEAAKLLLKGGRA